MKVIVNDKIIETSFIKTIEIKEDDAPGWYSLWMEIKFLFNEKPIGISIEPTVIKDLPDSEESILQLKDKAQRIIQFLDAHSDKPTWPFPVFEDPKLWKPTDH